MNTASKIARNSSSRSLETARKKVSYFYWRWSFSFKRESFESLSGTTSKGSKERIFNYRNCTARGVVENIFGPVSSHSQVLRQPMLLEPEKDQLVRSVACSLISLGRNSDPQEFIPPRHVPVWKKMVEWLKAPEEPWIMMYLFLKRNNPEDERNTTAISIFSEWRKSSGKMTALIGSIYWITSFPWNIHCHTLTYVCFVVVYTGWRGVDWHISNLNIAPTR